MTNCQWCGDEHGVDQLCQRAKRGMTRRSFCFLFGAGIAATALLGSAAPTPSSDWWPQWFVDSDGRTHHWFDRHDGVIAEVSVWNEPLTPNEVAALGLGASPLSIRPHALASYEPRHQITMGRLP